MIIGLTYDLKKQYRQAGFSEEAIAEFDSEETIVALSAAIQRAGHTPVEIGNVFNLTARLAENHRWDLVFNIAEGLHGRSREAQVPALLEAFGIPYTFSDPLSLALTLDKELTKRLVAAAGMATPAWALIRDTVSLESELRQKGLTFPLFAKPNAEGTGKGISIGSLASTLSDLRSFCQDLLQRFHQPVLIESFLSGQEFTVGILGTDAAARVVGVMEIHFSSQAEADFYSYTNKKEYVQKIGYALATDEQLARQAGEMALAAYRLLGCRDAGRVDLRADHQGRLHFLEINPLAGLHPVDSDLPILASKAGIGYDTLIADILASALKRVTLPAADLQSA